jgi:hypothetical protein
MRGIFWVVDEAQEAGSLPHAASAERHRKVGSNLLRHTGNSTRFLLSQIAAD